MLHLKQQFRDFILSDAHSCVASKTALVNNNATINIYRSEPQSIEALHSDMIIFSSEIRHIDPREFRTFAALFPTVSCNNENMFDSWLWDMLSQLRSVDERQGYAWSDICDSDTTSSNFSFSLANEAYFIVGMHPCSSRGSRQFLCPALIFNSRRQFDALKESGMYHRLQKTIRRKEINKYGSINPMLDEFGKSPEWLQYSGMRREKESQCPLAIHNEYRHEAA